jgi:hypothetical protein
MANRKRLHLVSLDCIHPDEEWRVENQYRYLDYEGNGECVAADRRYRSNGFAALRRQE